MLAPKRKAMTNLDSILKSRNITLPTKVHLVKAMVFPVVMYGCESWTSERRRKADLKCIFKLELKIKRKKAEHLRINALNCGVGEDS